MVLIKTRRKDSFLSETLHFLLPGVEIRTFARGCVTVDATSREASDACYEQTADDSTSVSVLSQAFDTLNVGDIHFRGQACFSSDITGGATKTAHSPLGVVIGTMFGILLTQI